MWNLNQGDSTLTPNEYVPECISKLKSFTYISLGAIPKTVSAPCLAQSRGSINICLIRMNGWTEGEREGGTGNIEASFNILDVFLKNYLLNNKPIFISDL